MRILRGIAALLALTALLVGIPVGLAVFGGNPLPSGLSWEAAGQALLRPASDRVLIGIVALAGWLVWAAFAASVIAEIANALPGRRVQLRLPGLGLGQKFAAVLIIAVVAMIATPHGAPTAIAEPRSPAPTPTATVSAPQTPVTPLATPAHDTSTASPAETAKATKPPQKRQHVHVVERGDYLWNLADRYLGDGSRWKEIAAANPGIDPDHIDVGQRLIIPLDRAHTAHKSDPAKRVAARDGDTVRVERGDSLSTIADDLYGSAKHWPDLYEENEDRISDPDLIEVGQSLQLPDRRVLADTDHPVHHAPAKAADADREADKPAARDTTEVETAPESTAPEAPSEQARDREQASDREQAPVPAPAPQTTRPAQPAETARPAEPGTVTQTNDGAGQNRNQVAPAAAASVGLLLAAGLITVLRSRRRRQLHARQPGRQVPVPGPEATVFEHEVEAQHQPLRFEHLDLVTKAIAVHCRQTGADLPALTAVRVADERIDLLFSQPTASGPPAGFEVGADGSVWTVHATDVAAVRAVDGVDAAIPPYPALVTVGLDPDSAHVLINLEAVAALTIAADHADDGARMMATLAIELALSPWSADLDVTFVGPMLPGFVEGLDHPAVTQIDDADRVLAGLEHRAAARRRHLTDDTTIGQKRLDPDLADAWCPHVVLFGQELDPDQAQRLAAVVTDLPRVAIAAVTTHEDLTGWRYDLSADGDAQLTPFGWTLTPQLVTDEQYQQLLELVETSGTDDTAPAPWWDHDADPTAETLPATVTPLLSADSAPEPPAEETASEEAAGGDRAVAAAPVTRTRSSTPRVLHALSRDDEAATDHRVDNEGDGDLVDDEAWRALTTLPEADRPMLRLIGEPELVGARGPANRRYRQRSLEILFYLLEHPGTTRTRVTDTFSLSRDYAKSIISNLRKTLGVDDAGDPYLPEMGQGYRLHDAVTCDLYLVDQLIGHGVNTAPDTALIRILSMVRGTPFLGADDWELGYNLQANRANISSKLTDAAHELTARAMAAGNLPLARWANAQGRTADPLNQTLMADAVRIETRAGNRAEVTRLADRMSATARELGSDLTDDAKEVLRDAIAM